MPKKYTRKLQKIKKKIGGSGSRRSGKAMKNQLERIETLPTALVKMRFQDNTATTMCGGNPVCMLANSFMITSPAGRMYTGHEQDIGGLPISYFTSGCMAVHEGKWSTTKFKQLAQKSRNEENQNENSTEGMSSSNNFFSVLALSEVRKLLQEEFLRKQYEPGELFGIENSKGATQLARGNENIVFSGESGRKGLKKMGVAFDEYGELTKVNGTFGCHGFGTGPQYAKEPLLYQYAKHRTQEKYNKTQKQFRKILKKVVNAILLKDINVTLGTKETNSLALQKYGGLCHDPVGLDMVALLGIVSTAEEVTRLCDAMFKPSIMLDLINGKTKKYKSISQENFDFGRKFIRRQLNLLLQNTSVQHEIDRRFGSIEEILELPDQPQNLSNLNEFEQLFAPRSGKEQIGTFASLQTTYGYTPTPIMGGAALALKTKMTDATTNLLTGMPQGMLETITKSRSDIISYIFSKEKITAAKLEKMVNEYYEQLETAAEVKLYAGLTSIYSQQGNPEISLRKLVKSNFNRLLDHVLPLYQENVTQTSYHIVHAGLLNLYHKKIFRANAELNGRIIACAVTARHRLEGIQRSPLLQKCLQKLTIQESHANAEGNLVSLVHMAIIFSGNATIIGPDKTDIFKDLKDFMKTTSNRNMVTRVGVKKIALFVLFAGEFRQRLEKTMLKMEESSKKKLLSEKNRKKQRQMAYLKDTLDYYSTVTVRKNVLLEPFTKSEVLALCYLARPKNTEIDPECAFSEKYVLGSENANRLLSIESNEAILADAIKILQGDNSPIQEILKPTNMQLDLGSGATNVMLPEIESDSEEEEEESPTD